MQKYFVTWQDIDNVTKGLVKSIYLSGEKFDAIYGIPRGGLIPATIISHKLNIPLITDVEMASSGQSILVCDDISDTGKTFQKVVGRNNQWVKSHDICYTYVAMFMRKGSGFRPHFIGCLIDTEEYFIFPWELGFEKPASWDEKDLKKIGAV